MNIYQGALLLKRTTSAMAVYGNAELVGQYLPKSLFRKNGKVFPAKIVFTITTDETEKAGKSSKAKPPAS